MIGKLPKPVPLLAVHEVHPGGHFAETRHAEGVIGRFHGNVLNQLDSLLQIIYHFVMSIPVLEHYSKTNFKKAIVNRAANR
jgi:hypothetical protein